MARRVVSDPIEFSVRRLWKFSHAEFDPTENKFFTSGLFGKGTNFVGTDVSERKPNVVPNVTLNTGDTSDETLDRQKSTFYNDYESPLKKISNVGCYAVREHRNKRIQTIHVSVSLVFFFINHK